MEAVWAEGGGGSGTTAAGEATVTSGSGVVTGAGEAMALADGLVVAASGKSASSSLAMTRSVGEVRGRRCVRKARRSVIGGRPAGKAEAGSEGQALCWCGGSETDPTRWSEPGGDWKAKAKSSR